VRPGRCSGEALYEGIVVFSDVMLSADGLVVLRTTFNLSLINNNIYYLSFCFKWIEARCAIKSVLYLMMVAFF
jgi:hypothetical protein